MVTMNIPRVPDSCCLCERGEGCKTRWGGEVRCYNCGEFNCLKMVGRDFLCEDCLP